MAEAVDRIFAEAMSLADEDKMDLVDRILASLGLPSELETDPAYLEELRRRRDEVRAGAVETVPIEDALTRARELLRL